MTYINCICGYRLVTDKEYTECPICGTKYYRYFNTSTDAYEWESILSDLSNN